MEYGLVAVWLLTYLVLGAAGLPVAAVLFDRLPDGGAGVAIPLSLTVLTMVALWVGHLAFGVVALAAGLVVLIALTVVAGRRVDAGDIAWGVVGETAVVFSAAFLFMVAVRAYDPAIHPILGEKFLDFGMLQTVLRADQLPPEDFWFANQPVSYYYGGHLAAALLAMLTDTPGRYAYNLALAGYYAMAVTGVYGLAGGAASLRGAPRRTGAAFGAFFFGFASNLEPVGRTLVDVLPQGLVEFVVGLFISGSVDKALTDEPFNYWNASRVIPGTINEFPLFAWLNGDLHAHMMGPSFLLVLLAVLFAYVLTPAAALRRRRLLVFGVAPVVGGLLAVVNTWSFPSVLGLTALALLFADPHPATLLPDAAADAIPVATDPAEDRLAAEGSRLVLAGGLAVVVEVLAAAWALPFLLGSASTRGIGLFPDRSGLGALLLVHGTFLLIGTLYLFDRSRLDGDERLEVLAAAAGLVGVTTLLGAPAVGVFLPLMVGGYALLRRDAAVGFETVLLVAGCGLALAVEFVYVIENAGPGRFNTVFKLYAEVWLYLSLAAGAMVAVLLAAARERAATTASSSSSSSSSSGSRSSSSASVTVALDRRYAARVVVVGLLVASTSLYGAMALDNHFAGESWYARYQTAEDPTLNGLAYLDSDHTDEGKAIRWLRRNVEGQPTMVTAAPAGYFWGPNRRGGYGGAAAPASLTGIPTVAGWRHAADFQGQRAYRTRVAHVRTIYTGNASRQARLLRRYEVRYVYYGPAEAEKYGAIDGEVTVDDLPGVTLLKRWGDVRLYRVDQSELPSGNTAT